MENSNKILLEIYSKKLNFENERMDYKEIFCFDSDRDKLELLKDIVSFANTDGGYIIYGVSNNYEWKGLDDRSSEIDDIRIIDFAKNYVSELFSIKAGKYEIEGEEYYLLSIEKKEGDLITFLKDGKYVKTKINGRKEEKFVFKKNDQYGRIGSSSLPINNNILFKKRREINYGIITNLENIKRPYVKFVERPKCIDRILEKINNKNIRNVQINGLGGIGKTSLIIDFCDKILEGKIKLNFKVEFIIWITGKKTLFLPAGNIEIIRDSEISYAEVLREFASVFKIRLQDSFTILEEDILNLMKTYNSLVIFDNMETINDPKIIDFILKFPHNSAVIFTTRVNIEDLHFARVDIDGFEKSQFFEYLENQILLYDRRGEIELIQFKKYYNELYNLIQGSPIMTNMIAYRLANGQNIVGLIKQLQSMGKIDSTYDSAMEFCFEEVFQTFDILDRKILFILSIPDSNEEVFSIPDIMECTGEKESVVLNKIDNLHNLSFCVGKNGNYSSPNLVKIFSSKKLSLDQSINVDELKEKYNKLAQEKNRLNKMSDSFYSNAKAYTYSEKTAAYMMKVLVDEFELTDNKDDVIKKMNNLEEENPNFAFIFFRRALFEKDLGSNYEVIRSYFEKALELDSTNDHYWAEFAFYIEKINRNEAIGFFKNAIKLNDNNCSAHHGLAICLTKLYNNKEELFTEKDTILKEYNKGYSNIENIYWIKHNIVNAHSHISYLRSIRCLQDALNVCLEWLKKYPNENKLLVLEGQIRKKIDPLYVNKERIKNMKTGIFRNIDDETIAHIIRETNYRKK